MFLELIFPSTQHRYQWLLIVKNCSIQPNTESDIPLRLDYAIHIVQYVVNSFLRRRYPDQIQTSLQNIGGGDVSVLFPEIVDLDKF